MGSVIIARALSIIKRQHGGLVIIAPVDDHCCSELLRTKYRCTLGNLVGASFALNDLAEADLQVRFPEFFEAAHAEIIAKLSDGSDRSRKGFQQLALNSQTQSLLRYRMKADELGALSGVDGAIVFTQDLDLWGFGAEVLCREAPDEQCWPATLDETGSLMLSKPISFKRYGTRHRAAFRFCRDVAKALCVVVSQDGAAKVVFNHEQKVVYRDHIERDFMQ